MVNSHVRLSIMRMITHWQTGKGGRRGETFSTGLNINEKTHAIFLYRTNANRAGPIKKYGWSYNEKTHAIFLYRTSPVSVGRSGGVPSFIRRLYQLF